MNFPRKTNVVKLTFLKTLQAPLSCEAEERVPA
jgi:hypothetical protein